MGGGSTYSFSVTYTDDNQVDATTVGNGDVLVSGPGGYSQAATLVPNSNVVSTDGSTVNASYTIPAPGGGTWARRPTALTPSPSKRARSRTRRATRCRPV